MEGGRVHRVERRRDQPPPFHGRRAERGREVLVRARLEVDRLRLLSTQPDQRRRARSQALPRARRGGRRLERRHERSARARLARGRSQDRPRVGPRQSHREVGRRSARRRARVLRAPATPRASAARRLSPRGRRPLAQRAPRVRPQHGRDRDCLPVQRAGRTAQRLEERAHPRGPRALPRYLFPPRVEHRFCRRADRRGSVPRRPLPGDRPPRAARLPRHGRLDDPDARPDEAPHRPRRRLGARGSARGYRVGTSERTSMLDNEIGPASVGVRRIYLDPSAVHPSSSDGATH